jgi:hypothetical protein
VRRISIRSLMAFVVVSAVAIAALRNADDYWAGGMILATPLLLGVALIVALCGEERARARRLGFAILGGGYFALAFMGLSERNVARLPTSWLLLQVHLRVTRPQLITIAGTLQFGPSSGATVSVSQPIPTSSVVTPVPASAPASVISPNRWRSMLPGAANYEAFTIVGHCLFALLAGLLGGAIAAWFWRRRERRLRPCDSPG